MSEAFGIDKDITRLVKIQQHITQRREQSRKTDELMFRSSNRLTEAYMGVLNNRVRGDVEFPHQEWSDMISKFQNTVVHSRMQHFRDGLMRIAKRVDPDPKEFDILKPFGTTLTQPLIYDIARMRLDPELPDPDGARLREEVAAVCAEVMKNRKIPPDPKQWNDDQKKAVELLSPNIVSRMVLGDNLTQPLRVTPLPTKRV